MSPVSGHPSAPLDPIQRAVRPPQAGAEVLAGLAGDHAGAPRRGRDEAQPLEHSRAFLIAGADEDQQELVAAEAAEDVAWLELGAPGVSQVDEQAVAGQVPVTVVDLLEPIEVHQGGGERYAGAVSQ